MRRNVRAFSFLAVLMVLLSVPRGTTAQEAPTIHPESAAPSSLVTQPLLLTTDRVINVRPVDLSFQIGELYLTMDGDLYDQLIEFFGDRRCPIEVSLQPTDIGWIESNTVLTVAVSVLFDTADGYGRTFLLNRPKEPISPSYFFVLQTGAKELVEAIKAKAKVRSLWQVSFRIVRE